MNPHETLTLITQLATVVLIAFLADEWVTFRRERRQEKRSER